MSINKENSLWSYLKGAPRESLDIQIANREGEELRCKHCGSDRIVRYGRYHSIPRLWCKECKRKFADNKAAPGMKTPLYQVSVAMSMYYEGFPLKAISNHLQQTYNIYPAEGTIYRWINRVSQMGITAANKYRPKVGNVWVAIETMFKIGGQNIYCWDIIDAKTRFLMASQLFTERNTNNARVLLGKAVKRAGELPSMIIADQLIVYIDNIELKHGAKTKQVITRRLSPINGAQSLERFQKAFKVRAKIIKRLKTIGEARNIVNNWSLHYNYFRPDEVLQANTPALQAGIKYPLRIKVR